MALSLLKITVFGIIPFITTTTLAFDKIKLPWIVTADTDVKVTIINDISTGSQSFDARFTHYTLYLSTTPPGWGTGPVCVLQNSTKIDVESLTVKIPASVGPRGTYKLTTREYNEDPYKGGSSGFQYSNDFELKGGSGEWGASELSGHSIGNADEIPCTAYDCVRKCNDENYPAYLDKGGKGFQAYKKAYKCTEGCPGVTNSPWSTWFDEDADGFEDAKDDEASDDERVSITSTASSTGSRSATTRSVTMSVQTTLTSTSAVSTTSTISATPTLASTSLSALAASSSASVATPSPSTGAGSQASLPVVMFVAGCVGNTIVALVF